MAGSRSGSAGLRKTSVAPQLRVVGGTDWGDNPPASIFKRALSTYGEVPTYETYDSSGEWEEGVEMLRSVAGIEHAVLEDGRIFAISREHDTLDWPALFDVEDLVCELLGASEVTVRAHQGRDLEEMFPSAVLLF